MLGRFESAANLVEQSVGPNSMKHCAWTVSGSAGLCAAVLQWFHVRPFAQGNERSSTRNLFGSSRVDVQKGNVSLQHKPVRAIGRFKYLMYS